MRRRIGFENSKIQKKRRKEIQGVGMGSGAEAPPHPGSRSAPVWVDWLVWTPTLRGLWTTVGTTPTCHL